MDDAALYLCFGEYSAYGIPETCQPVYGNDHDILHAAVLDLIKYAQPVFGTLVPAYPHPQNFLLSVQVYADSHIGGFLDSLVILPNIEVYGVHKDDGLFPFQRAVLPFLCNSQDAVNHMGYHLCGSIYPVYGRQVTDIPRGGGHALCIHGQHLVFDVGDICLILLYSLWFKLAFSISGISRSISLREKMAVFLL